MDRKANLPPPPASDHHTGPTAADANLTSSSSSSSSSSSFSNPDFLRQVHAVLKRHRPLGGMQSNVRRASRIMVPQTEASKNIIPMSSITSNESRKDIRLNKAVVGSRRLMNATTNQGEKHESAVVCPMENASPAPPVISTSTTSVDDKGSSFGLHKDNDAFPIEHEKSFLTASSSQEISSHILRNDAMTKENIQFQKLENHLGNQVGTNDQDFKLLDHRNMELFDTSMESGGSTMLENAKNPKYNQRYVEPVTGISVAGSSCITTLSAQTCATIQSAQTPPIGKTAFPAQVSSSPCEISLGVKDHVPPQEQGAAKKGCEANLGHQHDHNLAKSVMDNGVRGAAITLSSQDLPTCIPTSDSNPGQSNTGKVEKSRKKKYDPNVFVKVNDKLYQKLGKIGSGGSSEVYKVISSDCTIYALKKIKLKGRDYPTAYGFCQEIKYLNKLKGKSNIIKLIDYEVTDKTLFQEVQKGSMNMKEKRIKGDECIYMVLEYGEIDLAHMLSQKWKDMSISGLQIDENWLRFYWQQMLEAASTIHEERIVHSDLKPANFLLVRGSLKLIDFGIAKAIMSDTTNIQRDAQVGTLNYMSPEAFMCNEPDTNGNIVKCGRPSDIWSLGCILYQMVYGKTPFADYKSFWAKFKVVTDRNHKITYDQVSNPWLIDIMQRCLAWDRNERWRIPQLLQHPFLVPRVPRELHPLDDDHPYRLLVERIGTYWSDPQVSRICCELNEVITKIERTKNTPTVSSVEPNIP